MLISSQKLVTEGIFKRPRKIVRGPRQANCPDLRAAAAPICLPAQTIFLLMLCRAFTVIMVVPNFWDDTKIFLIISVLLNLGGQEDMA